MLVRMAFGSRVGEVVDFLPHEARAMLADGRATRVEEPSDRLPTPSSPVEARVDRVAPAVKARRRR